MKVFTCTDFKGVWPVGVSAIVVAEDALRARLLLEESLRVANLPQTDELTLVEVPTDCSMCRILQDGDY